MLQGDPFPRGMVRWDTPQVTTAATPSAITPEHLLQIFVKVRNFLEKTTAREPQNLKISLEDIGSAVQGRRTQGQVPQQLPQPMGLLGVLFCLPLSQQTPAHELIPTHALSPDPWCWPKL